MKKRLIILTLIMVIGLASAFTYADTFIPRSKPVGVNVEERGNWFKEKMDLRRGEVNTALKEGIISEDEAKNWEEHFNYMEKFYRDNGFMQGAVCHGGGYGFGYGRGIMRGHRWNR